MSILRLKIFLIVFCVVCGGLSVYFFVNAVVSKPTMPIKVDKLKMPKHFDQPGDNLMKPKIPDEVYEQVQDYKRYMDSTGETVRPSLLDSIKILEQLMYHN